MLLSRVKKRVVYFNQFLLWLLKEAERKNIFWTKIKTIPIPNSTADKTKKKNVNDKRLILS